MFFLTKGTLEKVRITKSNNSVQFIKELKVYYLKKSIKLINLKPGETIGWASFITSGRRNTSIISKDFAIVYELKQADFQQIIQSNSMDFVLIYLNIYI